MTLRSIREPNLISGTVPTDGTCARVGLEIEMLECRGLEELNICKYFMKHAGSVAVLELP
jgi:hypothetical protein